MKMSYCSDLCLVSKTFSRNPMLNYCISRYSPIMIVFFATDRSHHALKWYEITLGKLEDACLFSTSG